MSTKGKWWAWCAAAAFAGSLVAAHAVLGPSAAAGPGGAGGSPFSETVSAHDLAKAITEINEHYYVEAPGSPESRRSPAWVARAALATAANVRPATTTSLTREAEKVAAANRRMRADGTARVTQVAVTVDSVERKVGLRLVTLHVTRHLSGGPDWEELALYVVVDRTSAHGKLTAGQVIAVDEKAKKDGDTPQSLLGIADSFD